MKLFSTFKFKNFAARFGLLLFVLMVLQYSTHAHAQVSNAPSAPFSRTSRVDELFIWKISEELKLSVKEEKEISNLITELNNRKTSSNERIDGIIKSLAMADSDQQAQKFLKDYKGALLDYNKISVDEVAQVQKVLPKSKAAKYFVVKSDLSKRIRSLLSAPERSHERQWERTKVEKIPLGDPKIIEE